MRGDRSPAYQPCEAVNKYFDAMKTVVKMNDTLSIGSPCASCTDGATGQEARVVERKELRADRPVSVAGHARATHGGNEAFAILERLRKRYREAGDVAGAKYMVNAIRALRRGAE